MDAEQFPGRLNEDGRERDTAVAGSLARDHPNSRRDEVIVEERHAAVEGDADGDEQRDTKAATTMYQL